MSLYNFSIFCLTKLFQKNVFLCPLVVSTKKQYWKFLSDNCLERITKKSKFPWDSLQSQIILSISIVTVSYWKCLISLIRYFRSMFFHPRSPHQGEWVRFFVRDIWDCFLAEQQTIFRSFQDFGRVGQVLLDQALLKNSENVTFFKGGCLKIQFFAG